MPLGRPLWSFRGLPLALAAGRGCGASASRSTFILEAGSLSKNLRRVSTRDPPRGGLALYLPPGLLHSRGGCLSATLFGLLFGTSTLLLMLLLQLSLLRLQGTDLRLGFGPFLGDHLS